MGKKLNQQLLNEELKKFKLLTEYTFYTEEPKQDDELILGSGLAEDGEDPNQPPTDDSKTAATNGPAPAGANPDPNAAPPAAPDANAVPDAGTNPAGPETAPANPFGGDDTGGGMDDIGGGDDVEVDVTELVKGSEEATHAATDASHKTSELLHKFNDLEQKVASMDAITHKIDALEKEIIKRNPTPIEKLEMRSTDSFPYNIKLTDYWKDVPGYEANSGDEAKPKEYVLTKDDVDTGFVDSSIKKSFNVPEDYEEEEIEN